MSGASWQQHYEYLKAIPAHGSLWADDDAGLFQKPEPRCRRIRRILPQQSLRWRLLRMRGAWTAHRLREAAAVRCRRHRVSSLFKNFWRGLSRLSEGFSFQRWYLRHSGRHTDLPPGTAGKSHRAHHGSAAHGNCDLKYHQPSVSHCHQGCPGLLRGKGWWRDGVRAAPRTGSRCRYIRRTGCRHRRLQGNLQRACRTDVWHTGAWYPRTQLDHELSGRIHRV